MKKDAGGCFLCEEPGKGKKFTFYSGVVKGGTTHELLSCTVTFFERWSDLTMHEIHVCRDCQLRLWREERYPPVVFSAIGAGVAALLGLVLPFVLTGTARIVATALAAVAALALAGTFVACLRRYRDPKPKHAQLEPLVLGEAMAKLPEDHTYMTAEAYEERVGKGIIG